VTLKELGNRIQEVVVNGQGLVWKRVQKFFNMGGTNIDLKYVNNFIDAFIEWDEADLLELAKQIAADCLNPKNPVIPVIVNTHSTWKPFKPLNVVDGRRYYRTWSLFPSDYPQGIRNTGA
jgi:hypothetical protein